MINFNRVLNDLASILDVYIITFGLLIPLLIGLGLLLYLLFYLNNEETKVC